MRWLNRSLITRPAQRCCFRLGNHEGHHRGKILVASAGGPNGSVALKFAQAIASSAMDAKVIAAMVEPQAGDDALRLGEALLEKVVRKAGIDLDDATVERRVLLGNHVEETLAKEAESGDYDLVLLGASDHSSVRKRLFGTVPDHLVNRPGGLAIAVVRDALPIRQQFRGRPGSLAAHSRASVRPRSTRDRFRAFADGLAHE